jgi:hypothetical protein
MNAYGTNEDFTAWVTANGFTLPEGVNVDTLRLIGSSYIDAAYGAKLACSRRAGGFEQELEWPRTGHMVNGELVPDTLIPPAWVKASYRAAYLEAITPGWATTGQDPNRLTRREKVDVIEREFFAAADMAQSSSAAGMPADSIINGMVLPWLCSGVRRMTDLFRVI